MSSIRHSVETFKDMHMCVEKWMSELEDVDKQCSTKENEVDLVRSTLSKQRSEHEKLQNERYERRQVLWKQIRREKAFLSDELYELNEEIKDKEELKQDLVKRTVDVSQQIAQLKQEI